MGEIPDVNRPDPTPPSSFLRRAMNWGLLHWVRSGGLIVAAVLAIDLATLPFNDLASYEHNNPKVTAFQQDWLDAQAVKGKKGSIRSRWKPLSAISENLLAAVIVAEDGTFWSHEGFDWYEFQESMLRNVKEFRSVRGASTITQQLVKNLFLSPSKNPIRKMNEWVLTWYAERVLTKRRILELYLNVIEWGPGIYGAESAAQTYFGKSASELSQSEAIRLAAVIPNPKKYSPVGGSKTVDRRSRIILARLNARDRVRGRVDIPEEESDTTEIEATGVLPDTSVMHAIPDSHDGTSPVDTSHSSSKTERDNEL